MVVGNSLCVAAAATVKIISMGITVFLSMLCMVMYFVCTFDTVNRRTLLGKLAHHGIRRNILEWINNYLNNRQRVNVLENIHPLQHNISDTMRTIMFADDTSIFIKCNNIHQMEIAMNSEI